MGATGSDVYPVEAIVNNLAIWSPALGRLFLLQSGAPLTRQFLVAWMLTALRGVGLQTEAYTGHSFHIEAATTAARCGLEDSLIQTLGRWKSSAFMAYIKISVKNWLRWPKPFCIRDKPNSPSVQAA